MLEFELVKLGSVEPLLIIVLGLTDLQEWFTLVFEMDIQIADSEP